MRDVTPEVAAAAGRHTGQGAVMADVVKGGQVEQVGLKKDDIVVL